MKARRLACLFFAMFCFINSPVYAIGLNAYFGKGSPSNLRGGRIALDWPWSKVWFAKSLLNLTGYWDLGYAYWHSNGDHQGHHEDVQVVGGAPIFRLQLNPERSGKLLPFFDAGIGIAIHSTRHIAWRDLGNNVTFQDLLAAGFLFGDRWQYNLAFQYMHYSNASFFPPNDGLDVKYGVRFGYRFA